MVFEEICTIYLIQICDAWFGRMTYAIFWIWTRMGIKGTIFLWEKAFIGRNYHFKIFPVPVPPYLLQTKYLYNTILPTKYFLPNEIVRPRSLNALTKQESRTLVSPELIQRVEVVDRMCTYLIVKFKLLMAWTSWNLSRSHYWGQYRKLFELHVESAEFGVGSC